MTYIAIAYLLGLAWIVELIARAPTAGIPSKQYGSTLMSSSPYSYATYKIISINGTWLIFCDDEFIGGVAQRSLAEELVQQMVEARCVEHKASQVLIENDFECEKHLCRCFKEAPPGTLLS
jgi:hypothetical protein